MIGFRVEEERLEEERCLNLKIRLFDNLSRSTNEIVRLVMLTSFQTVLAYLKKQ